MSEKTCPCCSAREAALRYFHDHVREGEIGGFVDGMLGAAAMAAAAHVLPGKEAAERELLIGGIGRRFDAALIAQAAVDAEAETKQ